MNYIKSYQSPIGKLVMASDGKHLIGLWFDGQKHFQGTIKGDETVEKETPVFQKTKEWLDVYFSGRDPGFIPMLKLGGSEFRRTVCEVMLQIPYGTTTTYGALAESVAGYLGESHCSAQAVGGAVSHNPISIVIPCHRVVGADGSLTGYAGGLEKKVWLLEREGIDFASNGLFVPKRGDDAP